jgi:predicted CoA-binding protein
MNVMPVHKTAEAVDGIKCYDSLKNLPSTPDGVILVIAPDETEKIVEEIHALGIKNIWIQQGAESKKAIEFCISNNVNVIHGNCMLMFLERPGFLHSFHKWVWGIGVKA